MALLLVIVLTFSVGCGSKDERQPDRLISPELYSGTHERTVKERNDSFVHDGKTDYKIVVPENASGNLLVAGSELTYFLQLSTGIEFETITDRGLEYSADARYISIGDTKLTSAVNDVTLDYSAMGESGYKIVTRGNTVFFLDAGQYGYGLLYAAYDFLSCMINYHYYTTDTIAYDKDVKEICLKDFDIFEVPDFEWRVVSYNPQNNDTEAANRLRGHRRNDGSFMLQATSGSISHTLEFMFTKGQDPEEWFGVNSKQMCFTARGNEELMSEFVETTAARVVALLKSNPTASVFNLGQTDENSWCGCPTCLAEKKKYGTDSAVLIKWANRVAELVEKDLQENQNGRKFMLSTFAYQKTLDAPVKVDAAGNYVPIDDSVKLRDNLAVLMAIGTADYTKSFYDSANAGVYENAKKWGTLADNVYTWFYSTNFHDYLAPFNTFNSMQDNYSAAKEFNSVWIHDQSQFNQTSPTGFSVLKGYLNSQLQWQIDQNYTGLIDNFFENYFGPAAAPMRRYFEELRSHMTYLERCVTGYSTGIYNSGITDSQYWPSGVLNKWLAYIEEAYDSIEPLKSSDRNLYDKLYSHIKQESLSVRYLDIAIYRSNGNEDVKQAFRDDCSSLGITNFNENESIETLYSKWGI